MNSDDLIYFSRSERDRLWALQRAVVEMLADPDLSTEWRTRLAALIDGSGGQTETLGNLAPTDGTGS